MLIRISFIKLRAGGISLKVLRSASTCRLLCLSLRLPALFPEPSKERLYSGPRLVMTHRPFHIVSLVGQGNQCQEDVASVPPLGGCVVRHSKRGKWLILQGKTTQPLPESLAIAPFRGVLHRFRLGAASRALCRSKLSRAEPQALGGQIKRDSHWGWRCLSPQEGAKYFVPVPDTL